jgi:hypothetical protein
MGAVKTGRCHALSPDLKLVGRHMAGACEAWEKNTTFVRLGYDESRQLRIRVLHKATLPKPES